MNYQWLKLSLELRRGDLICEQMVSRRERSEHNQHNLNNLMEEEQKEGIEVTVSELNITFGLINKSFSLECQISDLRVDMFTHFSEERVITNILLGLKGMDITQQWNPQVQITSVDTFRQVDSIREDEEDEGSIHFERSRVFEDQGLERDTSQEVNLFEFTFLKLRPGEQFDSQLDLKAVNINYIYI